MKNLLLIVALFALLPISLAAQDDCALGYSEADYRLYALDAAVAGDLPTAEILYACWIDAQPESPAPWLERAALRAGLASDADGALSDLDRAGELGGSATLIEVRRAGVLLAQGNYEAAIPLVDALLESGEARLLGDDYERLRRAVYGARIIAQVEAGNYEAAIADGEAAYRVREDDMIAADAPVVLALGRAFQALGDERALAVFAVYVRLAGAQADPAIAALVAAGG